ncbi:hypothetical protein [Streptomyces deserti]
MIPAASGPTVRHGLKRGGDRRLSRGMRKITLIRMHFDPAMKTYIARRISEGKRPRDDSDASSGLTRHDSLGASNWPCQRSVCAAGVPQSPALTDGDSVAARGTSARCRDHDRMIPIERAFDRWFETKR